jgi:acetyltransferase-like isoleucine patch superfamily enzyme
MDFKRALYLSPVGRLISIVQNALSVFTRPYMVYGYKRKSDGKFLKNTRISSSSIILNPENLQISDNVWVWHYSILDASNGISIGEGCQIGAWVGIFTHSSHIAIRLYGGNSYIQTPINERMGYVTGSVEIGSHTFIGAKATIMPGIKIGKGCLIAAGTLVTKSVPDFSIVVGNPGVIKGDTRNLDVSFYNDDKIKQTYFDKEAIDFFIKNKPTASN